MGRVTCVSISSGATFGQFVETAMVGRVTFGRRSTGRRVRQIAPSSTRAAMRMVTATGRLTAKSAIFMGVGAPERRYRTNGTYGTNMTYTSATSSEAGAAAFG